MSGKIETPKALLKCERCLGTNIQIKTWVDANTRELIGDSVDDPRENWCEDCEDHVTFITT